MILRPVKNGKIRWSDGMGRTPPPKSTADFTIKKMIRIYARQPINVSRERRNSPARACAPADFWSSVRVALLTEYSESTAASPPRSTTTKRSGGCAICPVGTTT